MRFDVHRVADLTPEVKSALRTLSLAVYPPEVSAAWPGHAIEWTPATWSVVGWDPGGAVLCHVGVVLREARWNERAVQVVGMEAGVLTGGQVKGEMILICQFFQLEIM